MSFLKQIPVVVIGSGMTGLACARRLAAAGLTPLVVDKGRFPGGRVATRVWSSGACFDHGAQFIRSRTERLGPCLEEAEREGAVSGWAPVGSAVDRGTLWVGRSGMRAFPAFLARDLTVRQGREVVRLERGASGVRVLFGDGSCPVDAARVVVTVPAPQLSRLTGMDPEIVRVAGTARLAPCLTVLFRLDPPAASTPDVLRPSSGPVAWLARQSSKPDGPQADCWVGQAGEVWSRSMLDRPGDAWAELLLGACLEHLGVERSAVRESGHHRWRHARVTRALEQPFLTSDDGRLFAGGDWCLGPRVEAAWSSGEALADALLASG